MTAIWLQGMVVGGRRGEGLRREVSGVGFRRGKEDTRIRLRRERDPEWGSRGKGRRFARSVRSRLKCWRLWFAAEKIVVESVEGGLPG